MEISFDDYFPVGRFDLSSAAFRCCDESCNEIIESTREDYVSNQYWPASEKSSYLVDEKVLESWYHIRNLSPGTSEKAFVEHLERLSQQAGRVYIIIFIACVHIILFKIHFLKFYSRRSSIKCSLAKPAGNTSIATLKWKKMS